MADQHRDPKGLALLPEGMRDSIVAYVEHGIPLGHFLDALLSNDFMGAVKRADEENLPALGNWGVYLYNYAPPRCFGSAEKVQAWQDKGGLLGKPQKIIPAPVDRCGNTRKLQDGSQCPGCRACA